MTVDPYTTIFEEARLFREFCEKNPFTVTEQIVNLATSNSTASDIALEVLRQRDGLSPSTLTKKIFPKLKKQPRSPLDFR